jgi:drug/metabolite transporter (DMT)-like permease
VTHPPRRAFVLATLACVAAAFCWGLNAVIAKGAFEAGISPERLAQARVAVAMLPLLAFLALRRRDLLRAPRGGLVPLILFGISLVTVNWAYYVAIDRLAVGVAISLQYTAPVMVLLGTALVARRSPEGLAWGAGLLTLAGAILVSEAYGGLEGVDGIGLLAGVGAAVSFAAYLVSARIAGQRGVQQATSLFVGFAVAVVIWGVILPWWDWPVARLAEPEIAARVVAVGLLGTLLPFMLVVTALRVVSAAVAGIAATSEPVFAAGLAFLILGQSLAPLQRLGGACVVAGVLIAQTVRMEPRSAPVEVTP